MWVPHEDFHQPMRLQRRRHGFCPVEALLGVTQNPGDGQTLTCPHCGLVLTVRRVKGGTRLSYSTRDWRRLCKHLALDSPVLCLIEPRSNGSARPLDWPPRA